VLISSNSIGMKGDRLRAERSSATMWQIFRRKPHNRKS